MLSRGLTFFARRGIGAGIMTVAYMGSASPKEHAFSTTLTEMAKAPDPKQKTNPIPSSHMQDSVGLSPDYRP